MLCLPMGVALLQVGKLSPDGSLLQGALFCFDCQPEADTPVLGQERPWGWRSAAAV